MAKPVKTPITINYQDIFKILRIITCVLVAVVVLFVVLFFGILSIGSLFGCILLGIFTVYVVIPALFCYCPFIQQFVVFQTHVDADGVDFEKPRNLKGVRNIRIPSSNGITIGLWHVLPSSQLPDAEDKDESFWESSVLEKSHNGVIIYFHGVTGTRDKLHRRELYQVLQQQDYHVISCDYRGFGDSTKVHRITENGVVTDALTVYTWVRQALLRSNEKIPVFVWGHSLGSGISSHALAKLNDSIVDIPYPTGLVLESPFNNFAEELRHHSKLKIWSWLPFFDFFFVKSLHKNDIVFENDGHISSISSPILIIHAKDDHVIPSQLGKRLFEAGKLGRPKDFHPLYFVHFLTGRHNEMYKCNAHFGKILNLFMSACSTSRISSDTDTACWQCWHHHCQEPDGGLEILCSHCIKT